jgi:hypothetical protein
MARKNPHTPLYWHNLEFMYANLYKNGDNITKLLNNWPNQIELESFIDEYRDLLGGFGICNDWNF